MEVEGGESSSRKKKWERPPAVVETAQQQQPKEWSPLTLTTLQPVKERAEKRGNRISLDVIVKYFEKIDAPYDWLPSGWIFEEQFLSSDYKGCNKIYKDGGNNGGLIYLIDLLATLIIGRNKALFDNPTREQPDIGNISVIKVLDGYT
ncbi:hypothetical protein Godav_004776, partial [Gossypium davidsonii]|nr:hypothetical protein [Gossypium davidsonii]MBA0662869.1 hypothetical protein [Gossypium klotzschianum]